MEDEKNDHSEKENILILLGDYVAVRNFSNTDAGKLFHTICRYALGENIGDLEDKIQVAFSFFKVRLDENRKKWEKTRKARIESGKLGGAPTNPCKFDCRAIAWIEEEVEQWIDSRIDERDMK